MPDSDLAQWLQTRGFYTVLILGLLVVGLLLALGRRRNNRARPPRKPPQAPGRPRRGRR